MSQSKKILALVVCVILFAAALIVSGVFSEKEPTQITGAEGGEVVISEVLASNSRYPAPNGAYLDFVELQNLTGETVDISGYMLSDAEDAIDYTFPAGTVIEPYGYVICWCDKNSKDGNYAPFGISKDGTDTIYFYNSDNVLIVEKEIPKLAENTSYIRLGDGSWEQSALVTPGFENTEEGYENWLVSMDAVDFTLEITEVMSSNRSTITNAAGKLCDWIELYNYGDEPMVLTGMYFSDNPANPDKWQFSETEIAPGERFVLYCSGTNASWNEADFGLSKDGCTLVITGSLGNTLLQLGIPKNLWIISSIEYAVLVPEKGP